MRKLVMLTSLLTAFIAVAVSPRTASAANENNCVVTNTNFTTLTGPTAKLMFLVCSSGSVYASYSTGGGTGCTMDIDTIKLWTSISLAARLSARPLVVWYNTVTCGGASTKIITGLEMKDS
jgi:hypothetical protein